MTIPPLLSLIIAVSGTPSGVQEVSWAADFESAFALGAESGTPVLVSAPLDSTWLPSSTRNAY